MNRIRVTGHQTKVNMAFNPIPSARSHKVLATESLLNMLSCSVFHINQVDLRWVVLQVLEWQRCDTTLVDDIVATQVLGIGLLKNWLPDGTIDWWTVNWLPSQRWHHIVNQGELVTKLAMHHNAEEVGLSNLSEQACDLFWLVGQRGACC